jgi:hypothetical protein
MGRRHMNAVRFNERAVFSLYYWNLPKKPVTDNTANQVSLW